MFTARYELDFSMYLRLFLVFYRTKLFVKSRDHSTSLNISMLKLFSVFERRSKSDKRHAEEQLETYKEEYKTCVCLSSGYF